MKKVGYAIFIALLLGACMVFSIGTLVAPQEDIELNGNQRLAQMPNLQNRDGSYNLDYLSGLVDYAGDNFFHRQDLISAWSYLNYTFLRTPISSDVVLGSNGWLYYGPTLPDYTGSESLSDQEIAAAAQNLALVQAYCKEQGAQFLFTIAPNKNSVYPENMPKFTRSGAPTNADRLQDALREKGVSYLDLFAMLKEQDEVLYFTEDSHWNGKGAALGADAINKALGRTSSYGDGPFKEEAVHLGDLYGMLYPAGKDLELDKTYAGTLTFDYDSPISSADNITILTSHPGASGSLMMVRDSFGRNLYPYMADAFGKAYFSRSTDWRLDQIAERDVDSVVIELVERNISYLISYVPQMPAPESKINAGNAAAAPGIPVQESAAANVGGCVLLKGTLPETPDAGTSVYLSNGSTAYEAFQLLDNGFALHVSPDALKSSSLQMIYTAGGAQKAAAVSLDDGGKTIEVSTPAPTDGLEGSPAPDATGTPKPADPEAGALVSQIADRHVPYMEARDSGLFAPEDPITRGDAAIMLAALQANPVPAEAAWDDVPQDSPWYAGANQLAALKLMEPAEDGGFHPDDPMTKAELVRVLAAFWPPVQAGESFADVPADHPAAAAFAAGKAQGWLQGDGDNNIQPDEMISRMDAVRLANAALGRTPDKNAAAENPVYFPDVPSTSSNYPLVLEAAVSHTYTADAGGAETGWKEQTAPESKLAADFRTEGFHLLDGWSFYYSEAAQDVLRNTTLDGIWTFDGMGHQTTGDAELDAALRKVLQDIITPDMSMEQKLSTVFGYCRDSFQYRKSDVADEEHPFNGAFVLNAAKAMLSNGKGNCYNFSCTFFYLSRWLGLNPLVYSGTLLGDPHSWTEMVEDGGTVIYDPQMAWRWYHDRDRADYMWYFYRFVDTTDYWKYVKINVYGEPEVKLDLPAPEEELPADFTTTGFHLHDGYGYYFDAEKGGILRSTTLQDTWTFDENGHYTTGDADLDASLREIILANCDENVSQAGNLHTLFAYCRDNYTYRKRDVPTQEEFNQEFVTSTTKQMISSGKGNCYSFSCLFYHLSRWIGYDTTMVAGFVLYPDDPHCWTVIPDPDGTEYIYDTQLEWRYVLDWGYTGYTWMFYHLQDTDDNFHYIESHRLK